MPNLNAMKETQGRKDDGAVEFKEELNRELKHAERRTCNEKHDIREDGIRADCFTPSAHKVLDADLRHSEKPKVSQDPDLHADTTDVGINVVTGMKKGGWASSAEENLNRQKDKKVPMATRRKVFEN